MRRRRSKFSSDVDEDRSVFDRALSKVLRQLGVPFAGLRGDSAVGSGTLFCSTAQIETLVRLHVVNLPQHKLGARKLRAKGKVMVNIHRGLVVP